MNEMYQWQPTSDFGLLFMNASSLLILKLMNAVKKTKTTKINKTEKQNKNNKKQQN